MWAQPIGNLDRPTMALFDLGAFDLQAGDIVTVTDGVSTDRQRRRRPHGRQHQRRHRHHAGHATGVVELHLGEGEGGYWGYVRHPGRRRGLELQLYGRASCRTRCTD